MTVPHGIDERTECRQQDNDTVEAKNWTTAKGKLCNTFFFGVCECHTHHKQTHVEDYIDEKP